MKDKIKSLFYLFFPLFIGTIIGLGIQNQIDYTNLSLPPLAPSSYLFPIAWTILYLLIGLSYWLYKKGENNIKTNVLYYLQLFANFLWPILFFVLKWYFFSIFWILLIIGLTIGLIYQYQKENKVSGYLLIPYLLWLLFALYLNIGIYLQN